MPCKVFDIALLTLQGRHFLSVCLLHLAEGQGLLRRRNWAGLYSYFTPQRDAFHAFGLRQDKYLHCYILYRTAKPKQPENHCCCYGYLNCSCCDSRLGSYYCYCSTSPPANYVSSPTPLQI